MMAPLPAVIDELVQLARQRFEEFLRSANPYSVDLPLSKEAGVAFMRHMFWQMTDSVRGRMMLITLARNGDVDAIGVLRELRIQYKSSGRTMPLEVANYDLDCTVHGGDPHLAPRPKKQHKIMRDVCIMLVVAELIDRYPELPATRRSPRHRSACSITAEALMLLGRGMGEKAVERIWIRLTGARPTIPGWSLK